jgi:hypothetical protein
MFRHQQAESVVAIALALFSLPAPRSSGRAEPAPLTAVVNPSNQQTYILLSQSNWTDARAWALAHQGRLAIIHNADENNFVYSNFSKFGNTNRNLWIGLHDPDEINNSATRSVRRTEFAWIDGGSSSFTQWSPVEPNNPASNEPPNWEYKVHIWQPGDSNKGTWNNLPGDRLFVFGVVLCGVVEACAFAGVPTSVMVCDSGEADFSVAPVGASIQSVRWQVEFPPMSGEWMDLSDGVVSGPTDIPAFTVSNTSTTALHVEVMHSFADAWGSDEARLRASVVSACGTVFSDAAALTLCPADFDCSHFTDTDDFTAFVASFEAGIDDADFDGSGFVDLDDFIAFVAAFEAGC